MSAKPITNPVDRVVFDNKAAFDALWKELDTIAARYEDPCELHWRRRMALAIKHLREELKHRV